jgi:adenylylsulfate kinase-like enzyme
MRKKLIAITLLFVSTTLIAAPKPVAPDTLAHSTALFLSGLSNDGKRTVTYKAMARNTRFFLEEPAGVTVYVYDGDGYRKETFLRGMKLERAVKRYAK